MSCGRLAYIIIWSLTSTFVGPTRYYRLTRERVGDPGEKGCPANKCWPAGREKRTRIVRRPQKSVGKRRRVAARNVSRNTVNAQRSAVSQTRKSFTDECALVYACVRGRAYVDCRRRRVYSCNHGKPPCASLITGGRTRLSRRRRRVLIVDGGFGEIQALVGGGEVYLIRRADVSRFRRHFKGLND